MLPASAVALAAPLPFLVVAAAYIEEGREGLGPPGYPPRWNPQRAESGAGRTPVRERSRTGTLRVQGPTVPYPERYKGKAALTMTNIQKASIPLDVSRHPTAPAHGQE